MKQITVMILVPDQARADVMFCADRAYYHFATESGTEDGDLPGLGADTDAFGRKLLAAIEPLEGETPDSRSRVRIFVDNVEHQLPAPLSAEAVSRLAALLAAYNDSLGFFSYF